MPELSEYWFCTGGRSGQPPPSNFGPRGGVWEPIEPRIFFKPELCTGNFMFVSSVLWILFKKSENAIWEETFLKPLKKEKLWCWVLPQGDPPLPPWGEVPELPPSPLPFSFDTRGGGDGGMVCFCFVLSPSFSSEGGFFNAKLSFPKDYPVMPPTMRFTSPMWHPNGVMFRLAGEGVCNSKEFTVFFFCDILFWLKYTLYNITLHVIYNLLLYIICNTLYNFVMYYIYVSSINFCFLWSIFHFDWS